MRAAVLLVVVAGIISAAAYGASQYLRLSEMQGDTALLTYNVKRGELLITVTEDGNVESANNVDIKCQVSGGSSILWIVEDGTEVQAGDKLVEFDASTIEDQINTSITQTLKALDVTPPAPATDIPLANFGDDEPEEKKGGFFSRFKRS